MKIYTSNNKIGFKTIENKNRIISKTHYYEPSPAHFCKSADVEKFGGTVQKINSKECFSIEPMNKGYIGLMLSPVEDNNKRVIKAMKHIIRLCGGKDELF